MSTLDDGADPSNVQRYVIQTRDTSTGADIRR